MSVGADLASTGEVVFNTSMSGYQESVTDPSYAGQIIVFTYPLVGNYGVSQEAMESDRIHARAVVMREGIDREDAPGAEGGWLTWLADCGVAAIAGIDTRALVRHIRDKGAMRGGVFPATLPESEARERVMAEPRDGGTRPGARGHAGRADDPRPRQPGPADRGARHRHQGLDRAQPARARRPLELHPCDTAPETLLARDPDMVFLANGPGDPAALDYVVESVRGVVGKVPVFGICLGHQLLCRAVGLDTYKLPFGHRGANHPVKDLETGRIDITSQNHGFAVLGPDGAAAARRRRAGPVGDGLRRGRAVPPEPLRQDGGGPDPARRAGRHRAVPPRSRPGTARRALSVRSVSKDGRVEQCGVRSANGLVPEPFLRTPHPHSALMPKRTDISKILILGCGPIVIGQAAEFDYSGAQACKVLLEEGYEVVLVNSNPATIMTDPEFATATYIEPLLPDSVARVIERERPDALLPTLGGGTALNLARALSRTARSSATASS